MAIYPLGPLAYLFQQTFKLFGFPILWLWAYLMKVIPETCHMTWWRLFQRHVTWPDEGYSRDMSHDLMKVIPETCHMTWRRLFQRHVTWPDEGYSRDMSHDLMKVIPETCHRYYIWYLCFHYLAGQRWALQTRCLSSGLCVELQYMLSTTPASFSTQMTSDLCVPKI